MGLSRVGKFEEALAGLNRLLRADSTNGQYWYGAAQVFMAIGNSIEASRCLEQAQLLEPDLEGINDLLQQLRDQR
jgi:Flp pilus assembly protein TadD